MEEYGKTYSCDLCQYITGESPLTPKKEIQAHINSNEHGANIFLVKYNTQLDYEDFHKFMCDTFYTDFSEEFTRSVKRSPIFINRYFITVCENTICSKWRQISEEEDEILFYM